MDCILNIPGLKVLGIRNKLPLEFDVELSCSLTCPRCQSNEYRKKSSLLRRIRHENFSKRSLYLWIKLWKYLCKAWPVPISFALSFQEYVNGNAPRTPLNLKSAKRIRWVFHKRN